MNTEWDSNQRLSTQNGYLIDFCYIFRVRHVARMEPAQFIFISIFVNVRWIGRLWKIIKFIRLSSLLFGCFFELYENGKNDSDHVKIDQINFAYHGIAVICGASLHPKPHQLAKLSVYDSIVGSVVPVGLIFLRQHCGFSKSNGCILRDCCHTHVFGAVLVFGDAKIRIESIAASFAIFSRTK